MKIKDLKLEMISGQIIQRLIHDKRSETDAVDRERKTIVAKTIGEGIINEDDIVVNDYDKLPEEKKLTKEGDIVVKLSSPSYACLIDKEHEGMLVSSFCAIIRNIDDINSEYLLAYLNSDYYRELLDSSLAATTIHIASIGKINEIEIPMPIKKRQKEIGDYFMKMIKKREIIKKIEKLEDEKLSSLIAEAK